MKNPLLLSSFTAAFAALTISSVHADTLADWTFETTPPTTAGPYTADSGLQAGTATASGSHVGATVYSNPAGNGSSHSYSSTVWAVGDYYQFVVSATGYQDLSVTFDQTSSNTGPRDFTLAYSTDGTTFNNFASYSILANATPNPAWNATTSSSLYTITENLSSITALNSSASVYFRLIDASTISANGGTVATAGSDRVDNFIVTGTPGVVPEPGTLALASIGGLSCLVAFRRRK